MGERDFVDAEQSSDPRRGGDAATRTIALQTELNRLDLDWQARERQLMVETSHGRASKPSYLATAFSLLITLLGSGTVFILGGRWFAPLLPEGRFYFALLSGLFLLVGLYQSFRIARKASAWRREERAYRERRTALLSALGHA